MINVQKDNVIKIKTLENPIVNLSLKFKSKKNSSFMFKYKEKLVVKIFDLIYAKIIKENL